MKRKPASTYFQRWVRRVGVGKIARHLGLTKGAVSHWSGGRATPAKHRIPALLELASTDPTSPRYLVADMIPKRPPGFADENAGVA